MQLGVRSGVFVQTCNEMSFASFLLLRNFQPTKMSEKNIVENGFLFMEEYWIIDKFKNECERI